MTLLRPDLVPGRRGGLGGLAGEALRGHATLRLGAGRAAAALRTSAPVLNRAHQVNTVNFSQTFAPSHLDDDEGGRTLGEAVLGLGVQALDLGYEGLPVGAGHGYPQHQLQQSEEHNRQQ